MTDHSRRHSPISLATCCRCLLSTRRRKRARTSSQSFCPIVRLELTEFGNSQKLSPLWLTTQRAGPHCCRKLQARAASPRLATAATHLSPPRRASSSAAVQAMEPCPHCNAPQCERTPPAHASRRVKLGAPPGTRSHKGRTEPFVFLVFPNDSSWIDRGCFFFYLCGFRRGLGCGDATGKRRRSPA